MTGVQEITVDWITGDYRGLQGITGEYRGLQGKDGVTGDDRG